MNLPITQAPQENAGEFIPGYTPEMFPAMPSVDHMSFPMMCLKITLLEMTIQELTQRIEALEQGGKVTNEPSS